MDDVPGSTEILAALQVAVLVTDPQGRIAYANAAAEAALNMSANALKRRDLTELLKLPAGCELDADQPFAAFDAELGRRGPPLHADFMMTPFADRPGYRLVAIHHAATALRVGNRLEQTTGARAAIGVAAMLAHEIKNPLSGIRGAAQLIESRVAAADRPMTRLIQTEVDRIAALLDTMEDFTDTRARQPAATNIHEVIDHAREVARNGFGDALTILDAYDPSLPPVLVHRDSLVQVLLNLLKNAAEASVSEDKVTVTITTAFRHGVTIASGADGQRRALPIELCVIDDGPGAPAELADALFDPFISSKRSGKGLGLALADKLVREMGGIIQYAREGRPERTVFRLLLPRGDGG